MKALTQVSGFIGPLVLLLAVATQAQDRRGNEGPHGGDVTSERKEKIRLYIEKGLKDDLLIAASTINAEKITLPEVAGVIKKMLTNGSLKVDVLESAYRPEMRCKDKDGVERDATTELGKLGSEICFNLTSLAQKGAGSDDLIQLALHEHAHHFGWGGDAGEHAIGKYINFAEIKKMPQASRSRYVPGTSRSPLDRIGVGSKFVALREIEFTVENGSGFYVLDNVLQDASSPPPRGSDFCMIYPRAKLKAPFTITQGEELVVKTISATGGRDESGAWEQYWTQFGVRLRSLDMWVSCFRSGLLDAPTVGTFLKHAGQILSVEPINLLPVVRPTCDYSVAPERKEVAERKDFEGTDWNFKASSTCSYQLAQAEAEGRCRSARFDDCAFREKWVVNGLALVCHVKVEGRRYKTVQLSPEEIRLETCDKLFQCERTFVSDDGATSEDLRRIDDLLRGKQCRKD